MVTTAEAAKWVVRTEENKNRIVITSTDKERAAVDLGFTYTKVEDALTYDVNLIISDEPIIEVSTERTNIFMEANESKLIKFATSVSPNESIDNPEIYVFVDESADKGNTWRLSSNTNKPNNVIITASPVAGTSYTLTINPTE